MKQLNDIKSLCFHAKVAANGEIIVDNFAGGGGASTGLELAFGRAVGIAVNHDPDAILMHKTNHPHTEHYQASVWDIDPPTVCWGRRVGLAWFSPDCKHFSKAKGGKPVDKNIRGLAWITLRWAGTVRPRVIILENVEEVQTWGPLRAVRDKETGRVLVNMGGRHDRKKGESRTRVAEPGEVIPIDKQLLEPNPNKKGRTFKKFIAQLRALGYTVEWRELVAADYGAPTTRKRFFMIARCDGRPIVWPEPTHAPRDSEAVKSGAKLPWRSAAEIIDWRQPMYSVFATKAEIKEKYGATVVRPLADNTMRRVIRGTDKFTIRSGKPFLVPTGYGERKGQLPRVNDIDHPLSTVVSTTKQNLCAPELAPFLAECNHSGDGHIAGVDTPLGTITAKHTQGVCGPILAPVTVSNTGGSVGAPADQPIGTVRTAGSEILSAAHLAQYHTEQTEMVRGQGLRDPIQTVDAANRYSMVSASLVEYFTGGRPIGIEGPLHTVTSHDREALTAAHIVKFKGQDIGQPLVEPLQTITTSAGEFAVCQAVITKTEPGADLGNWPKIRALLNQHCGYHLADNEVILLVIDGAAYYIRDILMRMLTPRELYNAMGFPVDYIIDRDYAGNEYGKTKQVARCGNAVPPPFATALARANLPEWCSGEPIATMEELERRVAV